MHQNTHLVDDEQPPAQPITTQKLPLEQAFDAQIGLSQTMKQDNSDFFRDDMVKKTPSFPTREDDIAEMI